MAIPRRRALRYVYEEVRASLIEDGAFASTDIEFGRKALAKHPEAGNRLIVAPGSGTTMGSVGHSRGLAGPIDRPLLTFKELSTWRIFGRDQGNADLEIEQYTIARRLMDAVLRAIHLTIGDGYQAMSLTYLNVTSALGRTGEALDLILMIESSIDDVPFGDVSLDVLHTPVASDITAELDLTEAVDDTESVPS
jgi:hypothetical protein